MGAQRIPTCLSTWGGRCFQMSSQTTLPRAEKGSLGGVAIDTWRRAQLRCGRHLQIDLENISDVNYNFRENSCTLRQKNRLNSSKNLKLQTKSSLNKIFYKVVYHHIIYMCDFLVNIYDFFAMIYTGFHKNCSFHQIYFHRSMWGQDWNKRSAWK